MVVYVELNLGMVFLLPLFCWILLVSVELFVSKLELDCFIRFYSRMLSDSIRMKCDNRSKVEPREVYYRVTPGW